MQGTHIFRSMVVVIALACTTGSGAPAGVETPVAEVVVSPAVDTLEILGGTIQFTALATDPSGAPASGLSFTWTSTNVAVATIDPNGVATAESDGATTIQAEVGGKRGSASLVVAVARDSLDSAVVLFREAFDDASLAARGWYDVSALSISTTEKAVGTGALELKFGQGATSAGGGRRQFAATESLYLAYWVKYSGNWVGSGQSAHPHEFYLLTTESPQFSGLAFTSLTVYVEHNYQNGGIPFVRAQDGQNIDQTNIGLNLTNVTEARAVCGCNGESDGYPAVCYLYSGSTYNNGKSWGASEPYFLDAAGPRYKGDWHFVEAYVRLNTIQGGVGQNDGVVQYWFDSELILDHSNVLLRTGAYPNMKFNQLVVAPYIGAGSPVDQSMWVDELTVATARPADGS